MTISLHFHGLESTQAIRDYVDDKMQMLARYDTIQSIRVDLKRETHAQHGELFVCQATVISQHGTLNIEKTEVDLYKAIDKVKDHLREMIVSKKEKVRDVHRPAK